MAPEKSTDLSGLNRRSGVVFLERDGWQSPGRKENDGPRRGKPRKPENKPASFLSRLPGNFDRFLSVCSKSIEEQALNRRTFIVSVAAGVEAVALRFREVRGRLRPPSKGGFEIPKLPTEAQKVLTYGRDPVVVVPSSRQMRRGGSAFPEKARIGLLTSARCERPDHTPSRARSATLVAILLIEAGPPHCSKGLF